jgi:DNA-directed RNA polymerase subunit beta'
LSKGVGGQAKKQAQKTPEQRVTRPSGFRLFAHSSRLSSMSTGESNSYDRINDYASVRISLARPQDIKSWSFGEVKKPETINYRTYRPEKDGLFCERIFGPEKDWECACGKYRGMKYKGMICDRCGVKVTHSRVRRKRMGHIELAAPVVHIWFFKAMPSRLGNLLNLKTSSMEKVIYFQDYVVIDSGQTELEDNQLLTEEEYRAARAQYGEGSFEADMGAEAVRKLLNKLDLVTLSERLRQDLEETGSKQKKKDLINRLKIVESIRQRQSSRVDGAGCDPCHSSRFAPVGTAG